MMKCYALGVLWVLANKLCGLYDLRGCFLNSACSAVSAVNGAYTTLRIILIGADIRRGPARAQIALEIHERVVGWICFIDTRRSAEEVEIAVCRINQARIGR